MDGGEKRKKVPRQRGLASGELCLDGELCPEAQRQWETGMTKVSALRGVVWALTGAQSTHIDDVMSKVLLAFFRRLQSGPIEGSVTAYLKTVTKRESWHHLEELRDRAEDFVGDESHRLDDANARISVNPGSKVELQQAMWVLREEFSDFQLKAFVLYEGYGLQAPTIAQLLGGTATKASVRDAIRHARKKLRSKRVGIRLGVQQLVEE